MPKERLTMRKIREFLRLRYERKRSVREIAESLSVAASTVSEYLLRAKAAGINWPADGQMEDAALEGRLFPPVPHSGEPRAMPDFEYIHREMRRKGVTLQLLWQEYKQSHPDDGYQYSQFCERYKCFHKRVDVVMRQRHRAGEKMFVDFSGDGIEIVGPAIGGPSKAELFVAVLGASNYTYAEAFESQQLPCWIAGHIHAFEYFGGVAEITVPDNTKTAVTEACHYEPDLNQSYLKMAEYYNTAIIPARKQKPKDKAKVENGVLVTQRWILAALRNHRFFSIEQANEAIAEKLEDMNNRKFQKMDATRRQLYETLDKPALQPLPAGRYEFAEWSRPRVNIDYHVEVDKHYYSVHYTLVGEELDARLTAATVELFFKRTRVASHKRSHLKRGHTTLPEHMPREHREYLEWTPSRILNWAGKTGPATQKLAENILGSRRHPEQGYRSCLGLLRLGKSYGDDRLEAACRRALAIGACSYKSVKSILSNGLDRHPFPDDAPVATTVLMDHENIRGSQYYH